MLSLAQRGDGERIREFKKWFAEKRNKIPSAWLAAVSGFVRKPLEA